MPLDGSIGRAFVACSGGSNVGQIANDAAKLLHRRGHGRMLCLVAIAADLPGFVEDAGKAGSIVAVDGCEKHCAKKALEARGLRAAAHVVVTDLGIEKSPTAPHTSRQVRTVVSQVAKG